MKERKSAADRYREKERMGSKKKKTAAVEERGKRKTGREGCRGEREKEGIKTLGDSMTNEREEAEKGKEEKRKRERQNESSKERENKGGSVR